MKGMYPDSKDSFDGIRVGSRSSGCGGGDVELERDPSASAYSSCSTSRGLHHLNNPNLDHTDSEISYCGRDSTTLGSENGINSTATGSGCRLGGRGGGGGNRSDATGRGRMRYGMESGCESIEAIGAGTARSGSTTSDGSGGEGVEEGSEEVPLVLDASAIRIKRYGNSDPTINPGRRTKLNPPPPPPIPVPPRRSSNLNMLASRPTTPIPMLFPGPLRACADTESTPTPTPATTGFGVRSSNRDQHHHGTSRTYPQSNPRHPRNPRLSRYTFRDNPSLDLEISPALSRISGPLGAISPPRSEPSTSTKGIRPGSFSPTPSLLSSPSDSPYSHPHQTYRYVYPPQEPYPLSSSSSSFEISSSSPSPSAHRTCIHCNPLPHPPSAPISAPISQPQSLFLNTSHRNHHQQRHPYRPEFDASEFQGFRGEGVSERGWGWTTWVGEMGRTRRSRVLDWWDWGVLVVLGGVALGGEMGGMWR